MFFENERYLITLMGTKSRDWSQLQIIPRSHKRYHKLDTSVTVNAWFHWDGRICFIFPSEVTDEAVKDEVVQIVISELKKNGITAFSICTISDSEELRNKVSSHGMIAILEKQEYETQF